MNPSPRHKAVSVTSAIALGVGAMVGAGIFALLGEAGATAGAGLWISFLASGLIALVSGYSMARLGARYPAAGGIVEYLAQAFGTGLLSGWMSLVLYAAAVVSLSMIARAFGNYAAAMLGKSDVRLIVDACTAGITVLLVAVNLSGAGMMARVERWIVLVKMLILAVLIVAGAFYIRPELLDPATYPPLPTIFSSIAITFFAFEGFRVITNAAEDMPNPARTLPRAMIGAILLVMAVYVAVALTVFGNLSADQVTAARDYALAEAARPAFGRTGFLVVGFGALLSTASAINANLYAVTNVTYQLAKDGELPEAFGKPIAHSREGLVVSGVAVLVISIALDLGEIATIGSLLILVVHATVHFGHLRLIGETQASRWLVILAALSTLGAVLFAGVHTFRAAPYLLHLLIVVLAGTILTEFLLRSRRRIRRRTPRGYSRGSSPRLGNPPEEH